MLLVCRSEACWVRSAKLETSKRLHRTSDGLLFRLALSTVAIRTLVFPSQSKRRPLKTAHNRSWIEWTQTWLQTPSKRRKWMVGNWWTLICSAIAWGKVFTSYYKRSSWISFHEVGVDHTWTITDSLVESRWASEAHTSWKSELDA